MFACFAEWSAPFIYHNKLDSLILTMADIYNKTCIFPTKEVDTGFYLDDSFFFLLPDMSENAKQRNELTK